MCSHDSGEKFGQPGVSWNIKINQHQQKLVDICGSELPTNLQNFTQNFTQKDLTKAKIFQKVLGG